MSDKLRVDQALVRQGLAPSREKAQALIMAGQVYRREVKVLKPSEKVGEDEELTVRGHAHPFVGRGALKLDKALRVFGADVRDAVAMDIGAATGGFTDVLLQNGARHVYAIDVGYGQLDWKIRNDERVTVLERTNARYLTHAEVPCVPDITVMDVSFISVRLILPVAADLMEHRGRFYILIKPQFEAGKENVGKKGVVRDPRVHRQVVEEIAAFAPSFGLPDVAGGFLARDGTGGEYRIHRGAASRYIRCASRYAGAYRTGGGTGSRDTELNTPAFCINMHSCIFMQNVLYCARKAGEPHMKSVYMLMHQRKPDARELAGRVLQALDHAHIAVAAEPWIRERLGGDAGASLCERTPEQCEAVVSVGGDGTLLRANALAVRHNLPLLGVNVGRVGFLTEVELDRLEEACARLAHDEYTLETRMMLKASMGDRTDYALNDVVLSRGGYSRLIGVNAWWMGTGSALLSLTD